MKTLKKILWTSIAAMALTTFHHAYGAVIYEAPFRKHVAVIVVLVTLVMLIAYNRILKSRSPVSSRIALWVFLAVTVLMSIAGIGLFEGFYNHLMKNILFFSGMSPVTFNQFFPAPAYEIPNDFLFETTGILQFFAGMAPLFYLLKYRKINKQERHI